MELSGLCRPMCARGSTRANAHLAGQRSLTLVPGFRDSGQSLSKPLCGSYCPECFFPSRCRRRDGIAMGHAIAQCVDIAKTRRSFICVFAAEQLPPVWLALPEQLYLVKQV